MNISQLIRYTILHLISLLGMIVILTDGDLTLFSLSYLEKVCGTSVLLFTSISLFLEESEYLNKLKNWQYTFVLTSISNLAFLPFLIFLSHEEHLSLWFPGLLACCFMVLWSLSFIRFKWSIFSQWFSLGRINDTAITWQSLKQKLRLSLRGITYFFREIWERLRAKTIKKNLQKIDKPTLKSNPLIPSSDSENKSFLDGKTVLIYGATSALGQAFLDNLQSHTPQKLLLLDKDLIELELLTIKIEKMHPHIQVYSFGINTLTSKTIQSIFNDYHPDFIFDFDRYFCLPSAGEGLASFLKINLLIPYWLACNAHSSKTSLMISLHPEVIHPEPSFIHAEKILMSSLQRFDSSNLRIINIKVPLFSDDLALPWYLQRLAINPPKQTLLVKSAPLLDSLLVLAQQLINHPAHYGSLWSPLFAKKLLAKKLAIILKDDITQQLTAINHLEEVKLPFKNLIVTSHPDLAILQDTINLDTKNDALSYFLELEELLQKNLEQVESFLQAA